MLFILKKIFSKFKGFLSRLNLAVSSGLEVYKFGGVAHYSITTVEHVNLLKGKNILITGGSSGIGFCLAEKCVALGANVLITGRNKEKLDDAVHKISSTRIQSIAWDVSDISELNKKLDVCEDLLGGEISVLVNNAGILDTTDFLEVLEEQWDKVYATNSKGLFFLTQAVCNRWMQNNLTNRKVINISSQGGYVGATYPYRMSKWDVAGLTQGLGLKLCKKGIIVNGIAPGIVATAMQPMSKVQSDNIYCPHNPLQRFAMPEEISELGVFLISDASNFIVGQTILCDGGFSIK